MASRSRKSSVLSPDRGARSANPGRTGRADPRRSWSRRSAAASSPNPNCRRNRRARRCSPPHPRPAPASGRAATTRRGAPSRSAKSKSPAPHRPSSVRRAGTDRYGRSAGGRRHRPRDRCAGVRAAARPGPTPFSDVTSANSGLRISGRMTRWVCIAFPPHVARACAQSRPIGAPWTTKPVSSAFASAHGIAAPRKPI